MGKHEEDTEKARTASLSPYQREIELRCIDAHLKNLQVLRGINTGELYTWRGKFKALTRDYGIGFMAWYWTCWTTTGVLSYVAIEAGGVDAIALLEKVDGFTGFELAAK